MVVGEFAVPLTRPQQLGRPITAWAVVAPTPPLREAAAATGQVTVLPDPADGVVRSVPLVVEDEQDRRLYYSLTRRA